MLLHPSPFVVLPSSQASLVLRTPSPQKFSASQVLLQLSPSMVLPSSQTSFPSKIPLPQTLSNSQVLLHPSPFVVLPSSQASPASKTPSPQTLKTKLPILVLAYLFRFKKELNLFMEPNPFLFFITRLVWS